MRGWRPKEDNWELSPRQTEALQHRANGCSEKEGAEKMGISVAVYREYMRIVRLKMEASTTHEAVANGIRWELII